MQWLIAKNYQIYITAVKILSCSKFVRLLKQNFVRSILLASNNHLPIKLDLSRIPFPLSYQNLT